MNYALVDRVECPSCHNRRCWTDDCLDCVCCGGMRYVDLDYVERIVTETLEDIVCKATSIKNHDWLPNGIYLLQNGDCYLIEQHGRDADGNWNRSVHEISEQLANHLIENSKPVTLFDLYSEVRNDVLWLVSWVKRLFAGRRPKCAQ